MRNSQIDPQDKALNLPSRQARPTQRRNTGPWSATHTFEDFIGSTDQLVEMLDLARHVATHDFPVLLRGESGTGKDLLAQAIHMTSARNAGPFVPINCGATSDELLAAELFGYAEGAFTGAVKGGRKRKFELAHNGTLFLDEVESMSPKMQASLLRVLEEDQILRVGAERPIQTNVRVIAASQSLTTETVEEGRFRLDLYHRLAALPIRLPSLRERVKDIPQLAVHLLKQLGFASPQIDVQTIRTLNTHLSYATGKPTREKTGLGDSKTDGASG